MENNLLKNDETISNNQNDIVNTNTTSEKYTPKVIGMAQNLNVQFFVKISGHAQERYRKRKIEGLGSWRELLMDSDFGVQVFNAILTKRVKVMKGVKDEDINSDDCYNDNSFIYYDTKRSISIPLLWTNYMTTENGSIRVGILIKTVFWRYGSYKYNTTEKGQRVLSSDKSTFGYEVDKADKAIYQFNTLIPINFKIVNAMAQKYNSTAERCLKQLHWDLIPGNTPTRVAAGCIRKSLSYIIDMWLSDKLIGMSFTLTENRDKTKPPLYVGITCNDFNFKLKTFYFALRNMSFKGPYGENEDIQVTNNNDNLVKNILSNGSKVQDGLRRYAYISETHLKQIIKESLLKYLGYIL